MLRYAAVAGHKLQKAISACELIQVSASWPVLNRSAVPVSLASYATGADVTEQKLAERWEVPAGSDLRVSTRSPAAVNIVFGEPDAISVQV